MAEDRTALDHLLAGREALQREVTRMTAALGELDAVLERLGGTPDGSSSPDGASARPLATPPASPTVSATVPSSGRRPANSGSRRASGRSRTAPASGGEAPKSIRVHVLEMLTADNREFGLAEIIDRVHDAGIQAHDDAVRSITIKLMKDGRVERVGRGQYRLARRGPRSRGTVTQPDAGRSEQSGGSVSDSNSNVPEDSDTLLFESPAAPVAGPEATMVDPSLNPAALAADTEGAEVDVVPSELAPETPDAVDVPVAGLEADVEASAAEPAADGVDDTGALVSPDEQAADRNDVADGRLPSTYTPPLNLGQPWGQ